MPNLDGTGPRKGEGCGRRSGRGCGRRLGVCRFDGLEPREALVREKELLEQRLQEIEAQLESAES